MPFRGIVLGIDPSVRGTGLAVVDFSRRQPRLLHSRRLTIRPGIPYVVALGIIHKAVVEVLGTFPVTAAVAEEAIFVQNHKTAVLMGGARGAALGVVSAAGLPIVEMSPTAIKLAVSGSGRADKAAVGRMVRLILGLKHDLAEDEADAAAAAIAAVGRKLLSGSRTP